MSDARNDLSLRTFLSLVSLMSVLSLPSLPPSNTPVTHVTSGTPGTAPITTPVAPATTCCTSLSPLPSLHYHFSAGHEQSSKTKNTYHTVPQTSTEASPTRHRESSSQFVDRQSKHPVRHKTEEHIRPCAVPLTISNFPRRKLEQIQNITSLCSISSCKRFLMVKGFKIRSNLVPDVFLWLEVHRTLVMPGITRRETDALHDPIL